MDDHVEDRTELVCFSSSHSTPVNMETRWCCAIGLADANGVMTGDRQDRVQVSQKTGRAVPSSVKFR